MVGVAVGLFVVGGAIKLTVDSLSSNRRLLLDTRVNQDMRAAADLIARDLRRASYWEASMTGLWSAGAPTVSATNPYATINSSTAETIVYAYQRPGVDPASAVPLGVRRELVNGVGSVQIWDAGEWRAITDPASIDVTSLSVTPTERTIELWSYCSCRTRVPVSLACEDATLSASATRPTMVLREFVIVMQAQSTSDVDVKRELRETVRVRNDALKNPNGCPSS